MLKKSSKTLLAFGFAFLPFCFPLKAQEASEVNHIPRILEQVELDGKMDESVWKKAKQISLNYVTSPFENTEPPVKTTAFIFEDGETLFVAFEAQDSDISKLSAFYRDRDRAWSDDLVGIKLDTFNDSRLAYQFFVNPFGTQLDAIENEMTGSESDSWDGIWDAAGEVSDNGYIVEMAIPLRVLNFNESDQAITWGMELVRFFPREERYRISNMPVDRNNSCNLCQMGKVSGFAGAKQGNNLAIIPALVAGRGETRDVIADDDWQNSNNVDLSLDIKWGVTPDTSLVATINPDFSTVESDVATLSINNTFALFFPEKRTFFLENQDYFSSNYNLVYTRNIAAPDYGGKYTGRIDNHTFGVFVANDSQSSAIVPGNRRSAIGAIDDKTTNATLRYRYDFNDDLSVGWISTARRADDYHNYVHGVDGKWRITENDTLKAQIVQSDTKYAPTFFRQFCSGDSGDTDDNGDSLDCDQPPQEDCSQGDCIYNESVLRTKRQGSFTGLGYKIQLDHNERDWFANIRHEKQDDDFRADLGFINTIDFEKSVIGGGYRWYNEDEWWNRLTVSGDWDITHNDKGDLIEKELEGGIHVNAIQQSYFRLSGMTRNRVGPRFDQSSLAIKGNTKLFSEHNIGSFFEMRPSAKIWWGLGADIGKEIDFSNNRLGDVVRVAPQINWNPTNHIQVNLRHTYRKMDVNDSLLFKANLTDLRFTYQFDIKSFIRVNLVYSHIDRNQANYLYDDVNSHSADFSSQILYSYKVNPYTLFFLGYSDSHFENDEIDTLEQAERSIFMKISYAWLD